MSAEASDAGYWNVAGPGSWPARLSHFQRRRMFARFLETMTPGQADVIADIGVGYVGFEVQGLDAYVARARAAGAKPVAVTGIVTMKSGTREVLVRDPDVGRFVLLYEHPKK